MSFKFEFRFFATLYCNSNAFFILKMSKVYFYNLDRPVGRAVTRSSLEREVRGSNLGPVKSDAVLSAARHRCNISSKGAVLPGRNDAEMGPANSLHASATAATFLRKELCCPGAMTRRWAPQTRYTLRRTTASINERFDLILEFIFENSS